MGCQTAATKISTGDVTSMRSISAATTYVGWYNTSGARGALPMHCIQTLISSYITPSDSILTHNQNPFEDGVMNVEGFSIMLATKRVVCGNFGMVPKGWIMLLLPSSSRDYLQLTFPFLFWIST